MSDAYDKAKWHYDGDFPKDLPREAAFTHTGMFIGWLVDHDLISEEMLEDFPDSLEDFKARKKTGSEIYRQFDGVFCDDMVSEEGREFTEHYFDFESGQFLQDYEEILCGSLPSTYHVKDTWENYKKLSQRLDQRYAEFRKAKKK